MRNKDILQDDKLPTYKSSHVEFPLKKRDLCLLEHILRVIFFMHSDFRLLFLDTSTGNGKPE